MEGCGTKTHANNQVLSLYVMDISNILNKAYFLSPWFYLE